VGEPGGVTGMFSDCDLEKIDEHRFPFRRLAPNISVRGFVYGNSVRRFSRFVSSRTAPRINTA
jgi:hypothetical protein